MASLRANIAANFAGKLVSGLLNLALTPVYVRILGIESYGLVGLYASIQAILSVLDLGLGATLSVRLAALSASDSEASRREMRDLVRTFEVVYWLIGLASGLCLIALSPLIAAHGINAVELSTSRVVKAVMLMGVTFGLQWPVSLYGGAVLGLQRQVLWNFVSASASALRGLGAIATISFVSPTIEGFFVWQAVLSLLNSGVSRAALSYVLPTTAGRARFDWQLLKHNASFAVDVAGTTLLATAVTQLDKFLLTGLLPLPEFGYYSLATTASSALYSLIGPVAVATQPRLAQLVAAGDEGEVRRLYHRSCQAMSAIILPPAIVAAAFAPELLTAWTGNPVTVEHTRRLLPLLVMGTALNGLVNVPYGLQLAYRWSRFGLVQNAIAAVALVPVIYCLVTAVGTVGGAASWLLLNAGYVLIALPFMHRRLLRGEMGRWYREDVGLPLLAGAGMALALRLVIPAQIESWGRIPILAVLSAVGMAVLLVSGLATDPGRGFLMAARRRLRWSTNAE